MKTASSTHRLIEIDALRGIAALWVAVFHFSFGVGYHWLNARDASLVAPFLTNIQGMLGVDLFFMISGFVIFMTLERTNTAWEFVVSRFSRLYPGYWVCLGITTLVVILVPMPVQTVTTAQFLANATMANLFLGFASIDPSYWSLAAELAFYAWMMLIHAAGVLGRIEVIGAFSLLLSVLLFKVFPHLGEMLPWRLQMLSILPFTPLFFAGILIYRIRQYGVTLGRVGLLLACFLTYLAGPKSSAHLVGAVFVFVTFTLAAWGRLPFLAIRPLVLLGSISYAFYLLHQSIGVRIQTAVVLQAGLSAWIGFAIALLMIAGLAVAVTYCCERPAQRWLRATFARPLKGEGSLTKYPT